MAVRGVCCIICCQDSQEDDEWSVVQKCGHVYHNACILKALGFGDKCPTCRSKYEEKDIRRVYFDSETLTEDRPAGHASTASNGSNVLRDRRIKALEEDLRDQQAKLQERQEQLAQLNLRLEQRALDLMQYEEQLQKLSKENKRLQQELAISKRDIAALHKKLADRAADYKKAVQEKDRQIRALDKRAKEADRLQNKLNRLVAKDNAKLTQPELAELLGADEGGSDRLHLLALRNKQLMECQHQLTEAKKVSS